MKLHFKILGGFSLMLGAIGAFLPLMPTTCFVLFAAWCFSKSSPEWHEKLKNSFFFGEVLTNWEQKRCMTHRSQKIAVTSMLVSAGIAIAMLSNPIAQLITLLAIGAGIVCILSIKTCRI